MPSVAVLPCLTSPTAFDHHLGRGAVDRAGLVVGAPLGRPPVLLERLVVEHSCAAAPSAERQAQHARCPGQGRGHPDRHRRSLPDCDAGGSSPRSRASLFITACRVRRAKSDWFALARPARRRYNARANRQPAGRSRTWHASYSRRAGALVLSTGRRLGGMQPRDLAGLRRQALGRRRQDGDPARQPVVAERAVGRGRRGRLDQLVHQARGGPARARRGRPGQDLQARPRVLRRDMPLFGARKFVLRIPATPTGGPFGANKIVWHDEFLATEIGQVGTQFDGLGHIGVADRPDGDASEMRFYNGFTVAEIGDRLRAREARHREAPSDRRPRRADRPRRRARRRVHEQGRMRQHGRRQGGARQAGHGRLPVHGGRRAPVPLRLGDATGAIRPSTTTASPASAWTRRAGSPTTSRPA